MLVRIVLHEKNFCKPLAKTFWESLFSKKANFFHQKIYPLTEISKTGLIAAIQRRIQFRGKEILIMILNSRFSMNVLALALSTADLCRSRSCGVRANWEPSQRPPLSLSFAPGSFSRVPAFFILFDPRRIPSLGVRLIFSFFKLEVYRMNRLFSRPELNRLYAWAPPSCAADMSGDSTALETKDWIAKICKGKL